MSLLRPGAIEQLQVNLNPVLRVHILEFLVLETVSLKIVIYIGGFIEYMCKLQYQFSYKKQIRIQKEAGGGGGGVNTYSKDDHCSI